MTEFTHFDEFGNAHMVDVGDKPDARRVAVAEGWIHMSNKTLDLIRTNKMRKGDVLGVARIAGILAAKRTADLVPLCHPLALTHVSLDLEANPAREGVYCKTRVETRGPTGVEMEALCATQVALLTVYDMCKAVDRGMTIVNVRLLEKSGGRSGTWRRDREGAEDGASQMKRDSSTEAT